MMKTKKIRILSLLEETLQEAEEILKDISEHPELDNLCVSSEQDARLFEEIKQFENQC